MRHEVCTICGEEVRYGVRDGKHGIWHRNTVDHNATFGVQSVHPFESRRMRDEWLREHGELSAQDERERVEPIPDPTTYALEFEPTERNMTLDDREVAVGGARLVYNKARKAGWTVRATYACGPWLHAVRQEVSRHRADHVKVTMQRGVEHAVATWLDGSFQSGWYWRSDGPSLESVNSKTLSERLAS